MSSAEVPAGWNVEEWLSLRSSIKLVQNSLPSARATTTSLSNGVSSKATGTFAQLPQSHATSVILDKYFLASATLYEGGNDDVEIG
jgi:hypothetical protein